MAATAVAAELTSSANSPSGKATSDHSSRTEADSEAKPPREPGDGELTDFLERALRGLTAADTSIEVVQSERGCNLACM